MSTHRHGSIDKVSVIKVSADDTERAVAVTIKRAVPADEKMTHRWRWPQSGGAGQFFEINNRFLPSRPLCCWNEGNYSARKWLKVFSVLCLFSPPPLTSASSPANDGWSPSCFFSLQSAAAVAHQPSIKSPTKLLATADVRRVLESQICRFHCPSQSIDS